MDFIIKFVFAFLFFSVIALGITAVVALVVTGHWVWAIVLVVAYMALGFALED